MHRVLSPTIQFATVKKYVKHIDFTKQLFVFHSKANVTDV